MEQKTGTIPVVGALYAFVFGRPGGKQSSLVRLAEVLCTFLFVVMTVVLFLQTIARLFDVSFFWAEELSRYAMVWIIFLGSTVAVYQGSHTNIGVFVELVPKAIRRYVEALVSLASAAVIGIIAWNGITVFKVAMMGRSSATGIPLGYVFGVVTFCGSLMVIFFINRAALKVLGKPLPEDEFTEQQKEEVEL
jgi:TRAP-type C4-dicarboxylate transport system permease small subunit